MIGALWRPAMPARWATAIRMATIKAAARRPYAVPATPSAPATVVIAGTFIHINTTITDLAAAIIVAVVTIARGNTTSHSDQQHCQAAAHRRFLQTVSDHVFHGATSLLSA
jgi:hypothetical protein